MDRCSSRVCPRRNSRKGPERRHRTVCNIQSTISADFLSHSDVICANSQHLREPQQSNISRNTPRYPVPLRLVLMLLVTWAAVRPGENYAKRLRRMGSLEDTSYMRFTSPFIFVYVHFGSPMRLAESHGRVDYRPGW